MEHIQLYRIQKTTPEVTHLMLPIEIMAKICYKILV